MKSRSLIPESHFWLIFLGAIYIALQLFTGGNYPLFRDELYYIDCAGHPAFGYVDHPPVSILILSVWKALFGTSLLSLRVLPALSGAVLIYLSGIIASQIGGSKWAQTFTGLLVFFTPNFLAVSGFYSMNPFDLVFWALLFITLLRIINTGNSRLWLVFGIIAGLGLMNKISIGFFLASMAVSMLFTPERKYFKDKYFWLGGLTALVIFLPYILWNVFNNYPAIEFMQNAAKYKIARITPLDFFLAQILEINPFNLLLWLGGLFYLLFSKKMQPYKIAGLIYVFTFTLLALLNSKPYYLAAAYTPLLASGAVGLSVIITAKKWNWLKTAAMIYFTVGGLVITPFATPVLSPESYISYSNFLGISPKNAENSSLGQLPQHFADRFGWEEMAQLTANAYNRLSPEEKQKTGIFAQNYGEAGAVNYYGKKLGLPQALCGHNSHYLWFPEDADFSTLIIIGGEKEDYLEYFDEVTEFGRTESRYSMPYENNLPVYIARKPKVKLKDLREKIRFYI